MANAFVFDPNRCTGCHACRLACTIENELRPSFSWRRIETSNVRRHPRAPLYHLSLACNHCEVPACAHACPALAYRRDELTGAVLLDESKCIGCKYCSWACPYDAPVLDANRRVMTKCTFCVHRLLEGGEPACASLCPTGALGFADLDESRLENAVEGFPRSDLGPRIRIEPLKENRTLPLMSVRGGDGSLEPESERAHSPISLRSEWSLVGFTLLGATLVAAVGSAVLTGTGLPAEAFAAAVAVGMGLGAAHLGRPWRAYRAILNVRRSWLSREIVAFSGFSALATLYLALGAEGEVLGLASLALGLAALFSIDRVYSVLSVGGPPHTHSASVLLTGLFLTGVLGRMVWPAAAVGGLKMVLYFARKVQARRDNRPVRPLVGILRIALGLGVPLLLWPGAGVAARIAVVGGALLGELIDRCEFYAELESESPRRQLELALRRCVAWKGPGADVHPASA